MILGDGSEFDMAKFMPKESKFAELIVRECANIDFRREVGLTADDDYEIGKVIKHHFGVNE
jgi:hypothetical protein